MHTITFSHRFLLFGSKLELPWDCGTIENDAKTLPCARSLICFTLLFFPVIFINYKLFTICRKKNRNNKLPPGIKKTFSFKNISSCLLAVAYFVVLYIPLFVYVALRMISKEKTYMMNDAELAAVWGRTISSMNGTFNCLIFFWKNTILRTEGMKVIKTMKAFGRVQSSVIQSERCNQGQRQMARNT